MNHPASLPVLLSALLLALSSAACGRKDQSRPEAPSGHDAMYSPAIEPEQGPVRANTPLPTGGSGGTTPLPQDVPRPDTGGSGTGGAAGSTAIGLAP